MKLEKLLGYLGLNILLSLAFLGGIFSPGGTQKKAELAELAKDGGPDCRAGGGGRTAIIDKF